MTESPRVVLIGVVALASAAAGLVVGLSLGSRPTDVDPAEIADSARVETAVAEREKALVAARHEIDALRTRLDAAERDAAAADESARPAELESMEEALADSDEEAAESDSPPTLDELLADLRGRDARARFRALRDLETLSPEDRARAFDSVKEMLSDENNGIRFAALEALVKLAPEEAAPILAQFATDPSETDFIRSRALDVLAARNDSSAAAAIQKAYETGMKGPAARALQKMGDNSLADAWYDELSRDLTNADSALRARSIASMGTLKLPSSLSRISESADDPNSNVRQSVASALGQLRDEAALPTLRKLADDPVESVKRSARASIRRIENPNEDERFRGGDWAGGGAFFGGGDRGRDGERGRRR